MAGFRRVPRDPTQITAEDLLNSLKLGVDLPRIEVTGGRIRTMPKPLPAAPPKSYTLPEREQMKYVDQYLSEETRKESAQLHGSSSQQTPLSQMSEIEEESVAGTVDLQREGSTEMFRNYDFTCRYNPNLPTTKQRDEILAAIKNQQVVIIEGATGSGKTTQVPQFILDDCQSRNEPCNIAVTQPRRIAAISIATRVCQERSWNVGGIVGYKVGMDKSKFSRDTCITYMTTGIFLKQLVNRKSMDDYTHVILDEVHERDQDMDFVLLVVRKFLRSVDRRVKVILMSASFDVDRFGVYFSMPVLGRLEQPLCLKLERTKYQITEFWLRDLMRLGEIPEIDEKRPRIDDKALQLVKSLLISFDAIELEEQKLLHSSKKFAPKRGGVLIFLPGLEDIRRLDKVLNDEERLQNLQNGWWILTLHSELTEQSVGLRGLRVFETPAEGQRKVILSTNIAESSITVPDITYVIDFCLTKNLVCDRQTNYTSLQVEWASKANCIQRKGRTGRVGRGRVYRMVPEEFYHGSLPDYSIPEMRRCPLEGIILNTKILDIDEPRAVLAFALDPPKVGDIERSVLTLKEVGALDSESNGVFTPFDGNLTLLGRILAQLPVDVHIGKLIVLGYLFGFYEECLIIGAGLSLPSVFCNLYKRELECWSNKVAFSDKSFSDCFAVLNAFRAWKKRRDEQSFKTAGLMTEKAWADFHLVLPRKLRDVEMLVEELRYRLEHFKIGEVFRTRDPKTAEDMLILKIIITGAFYPHYFVQGDQDEKEIARYLSGKDPSSTVVMSGLPLDHACLYEHEIEQIFKNYQVKTSFESSRCFVEFQRSTNYVFGGMILPAVYIAIKRRLMHEKFTITLLAPETIRKELQAIELIKEKRNQRNAGLQTKISLTSRSDLDRPNLPALSRSMFYIKIIWQGDRDFTNYINFWAQYDDQDSQVLLHKMINVVNNTDIKMEPDLAEMGEPIRPGLLCLAPCAYVKHAHFYRPYCRARIEEIQAEHVDVTFFDYGYVARIHKQELRLLDTNQFPVLEHPALAFEFVLSEIKPSAEYIHKGWPPVAIKFLKDKTENARTNSVHCEVYSVVKRVVHLELYVGGDGSEAILDINVEFLKNRWADECEESYLSKQNHSVRQNFNEYDLNVGNQRMANYNEDDDCFYVGDICDRREFKHTKNVITIKGPNSPLEVKFASLQKCGVFRPVRIEPSSVNTVVLDAEPQDACARMMVAGAVGFNASNEVMVVRNTTILPNIHNLPALVSMIFAPQVEMRTDKTYSRYTGVLCGLGYDKETKAALYEEHDMEIAFDTIILDDDLKLVNFLREEIHGCLRKTSETNVLQTAANSQNQLVKSLKTLICHQRKTRERTYFEPSFRWGMIPQERVSFQPSIDEDAQKLLINGIRLRDAAMQSNYQELKYWEERGSESQFKKMKCLFCSVDIDTFYEFKIHIKSKDHRNSLKYLFGSKN